LLNGIIKVKALRKASNAKGKAFASVFEVAVQHLAQLVKYILTSICPQEAGEICSEPVVASAHMVHLECMPGLACLP
jgi:hypothetical protein